MLKIMIVRVPGRKFYEFTGLYVIQRNAKNTEAVAITVFILFLTNIHKQNESIA